MEQFKIKKIQYKEWSKTRAVASPIFFSNYLDDIFKILKDSGYGCWIGPHFYGIEGYADDLALLSPDRAGLQEMLNLCKNYFYELKITISTNVDLKKSKTKCMAFGINSKLAPITLHDVNLPWWEETWPHLGHLFHCDQSPHHDLLKKRAQFIGKLHSFRQEFGNIDPLVYTRLVSVYLTSFYGSNLWDLYDNI